MIPHPGEKKRDSESGERRIVERKDNKSSALRDGLEKKRAHAVRAHGEGRSVGAHSRSEEEAQKYFSWPQRPARRRGKSDIGRKSGTAVQGSRMRGNRSRSGLFVKRKKGKVDFRSRQRKLSSKRREFREDFSQIFTSGKKGGGTHYGQRIARGGRERRRLPSSR